MLPHGSCYATLKEQIHCRRVGFSNRFTTSLIIERHKAWRRINGNSRAISHWERSRIYYEENKRKGNRTTHAQQKIPSVLSCQDEFFSTIANWFLYWTLCLSFEIFRSDPVMQIIHAVAGDKSIRTLTFPHLKIFINAEWNTFIKFVQKEAHDNHAEAMFNKFCQFIYDGCTWWIKRSINTLECNFQIGYFVITMP